MNHTVFFGSLLEKNPQREIAEYGGKAEGLALLQKIPDISVPEWIALPFRWFENHLDVSFARQLIDGCENDPSIRQKIRQKIRSTPLDSQMIKELEKALSQFQMEMPLSIRSSALIEDRGKSSFAGLFHTELNVIGVDSIVDAIKSVWASSFSDEVVAERTAQGIPQTACGMGVIIQRFIDPKASAVVTSKVLGSNYDGIQISANFGVGLTVVDGEVSTDLWIVHPQLRYILEEQRGSKMKQIHAAAQSGLSEEVYSGREMSLTRSEVKEIAFLAGLIRDVVSYHIDVEVAIDKLGKIWMVQQRPLVQIAPEKATIVSPDEARKAKKVANGNYSLPGAISGRLVYIPNWKALAEGKVRVEQGDIALCVLTTNVWSQHLSNAAGLITKEGGASSHPILLFREKRRPCLVGIPPELFEHLVALNGSSITLDGHNGVVYEGIVGVCEANEKDLMHRFEPISIRPWPQSEPNTESLQHNDMVFNVEGKWWRKTPTFPVKKLQADINILRFSLLDEVAGRSVYVANGIYHEGYVGCEMCPFVEYIRSFAGIQLDEAEAFNDRGKKYMQRFIEICADFTPKLWEEYVFVYARMRAFVWISGALRFIAERNVDELGCEIRLPRYYLDKAAEEIQKGFSELDIEMQKEVHFLAKKLLNYPPVKDVFLLQDEPIFDEILSLAKKYRFEHQIALHKPLDPHFAYRRLLAEIEHIKQGGVFSSEKGFSSARYLPEHPELIGWITISLKNRILQSDAHHIESRGRALIRDRLIEYYGEDIFERSLEEIDNVKK